MMPVALDIIVAPIETLARDAVVNAANRQLLPGTGVDGALRRAAGPELTKATSKLGPLDEGAAIVTPGFKAPAQHIIHTAAPIWFVGEDVRAKETKLASCYRNCIAHAGALGLASIGFPAIGTGNFGWPRERACSIAIRATREALDFAPSLRRVVFCCFNEADAELYRAALQTQRDSSRN